METINNMNILYKEVTEKIVQGTCNNISDNIFSYIANENFPQLFFKKYSPRNTMPCDRSYNYTSRYSFMHTYDTRFNRDTLVNKRIFRAFHIQYLLGKITKKNGKHRYYIIEEKDVSGCAGCGSRSCFGDYCRDHYEYNYEYKSLFVGLDLTIALALFNEIDK